MTDDPDGLADSQADGTGADDVADAPSAERVRELARELERAGRPHARVAVVRREPPVSANVGDRALVTPEGDLVGWVGGVDCAQSVVVREATAAIDRGESVLLGLAPDPAEVDRPGVEAFPMTCHSGGTLELFVEPVLPGPDLVVVGDSPVARAVARLGGEVATDVTVVVGSDSGVPAGASDGTPAADETVRATDPEAVARAVAGADSVVVASMGESDALGVEAGLRAGADYVGLVASDRRRDEIAGTVADRLGTDADAVADAVTTPAGLDINARSPEEIAVSVLAELVALERDAADPIPVEAGDTSLVDVPEPSASDGDEVAVDDGSDRGSGAEAEPSVDPVCGMDVEVDEDTPAVEHGGETYHFCGQGCADAFAAEPERYADGVGADG